MKRQLYSQWRIQCLKIEPGRRKKKLVPILWVQVVVINPNQINNVLAFPGIFKGALKAGATCINDAMKEAGCLCDQFNDYRRYVG